MVQFDRTVEPDGSIVLRVAGEIDLAVIEDLKAAVRACLAERAPLEIDLSGLEFIDSSGLGALVQLLKEAVGQGSSFTLTNVRASTYRLLQITGLAAVFDVRVADQDPTDVAST